MDKSWIIVEEFPRYLINDDGRVYSLDKNRVVVQTPTQNGTLTVAMTRNKSQFRLTTSRLVAAHFLPTPPREDFNTIIHLDGNPGNCRASNLMWRPRWFAIEYHKEIRYGYQNNFKSLYLVEQTGEVFDSLVDCAMRHGLLQRMILGSYLRGGRIFPTGYTITPKI